MGLSQGDLEILQGQHIVHVLIMLANDRQGRQGVHAQAQRQHLQGHIGGAGSLQCAQGLLLKA